MSSRVLVAGGGVAALEFVLALREAGTYDVTVVAPEADLVLRPMLLAETFGAAVPEHRPLRALADEIGFAFVRGAVVAVEPGRVALRGGGTLAYDTLVLAPGARRLPAFEGALHIGLDPLDELTDARSVAFLAPTATGWLLPLYEAALLTARRGVKVTLVSAEPEPLAIFGREVSARVAQALAEAGVERAREVPAADRIVSLPLLRGPEIAGVPVKAPYGLIPIDGYCRVVGLAHAYAIGDATDFPIKQGGIACQQARVAAADIAGAPGAPFRPQLRATLLTGEGALALGDAEHKIPGHYLAERLTLAS